jgi:hypothetical protein
VGSKAGIGWETPPGAEAFWAGAEARACLAGKPDVGLRTRVKPPVQVRRPYSPPWIRRGGRDLKKMSRSYLIGSGRGGLFKHPIIGGVNKPPRLREAKVASRNLLDRAATPPYPRRGIKLTDYLFFSNDSFAALA